MGGRSRPVLIGVLLGLLLVAGAIGYAFLSAQQPASGSADAVVLIALVEDADGAQVAGVIALADPSRRDEPLEIYDPMTVVESSPTSFDSLKDQYSFGGGAAIASVIEEAAGIDSPSWIVLPQDVWVALADEAGGMSYVVPQPVNAYVGGDLYVVPAGDQVLSGGESLALLADALVKESQDERSDIERLGDSLVRVLLDEWEGVRDSVDTGKAASSEEPESLQ